VHPATVISTRHGVSGAAECYVHFAELDKRLDSWVPREQLGEEVVLGQARSEKRRKSSISGAEGDHLSPGTNNKSHHVHELTKVRNIHRVQLGKHEIDCWYYSPYPGKHGKVSKLYICEITFKYFASKEVFKKYVTEFEPHRKTPPGSCIYVDPERRLRAFEIDGRRDELFGQNLCLFGKLFIEHKTLSFDPTPFFFYVLYEEDAEGLHPVGYFSKERDSREDYNLACIVTLPPFQRRGYGKFLISLSYEVTKKLGQVGSPEKPLSDLGKLSYRSYWSYVLLDVLKDLSDDALDSMSIDKLSKMTGFKPEDILSTMQSLSLIYQLKGQFVIRIDRREIATLLRPFQKRRFAESFCKSEILNLDDSVDRTGGGADPEGEEEKEQQQNKEEEEAKMEVEENRF